MADEARGHVIICCSAPELAESLPHVQREHGTPTGQSGQIQDPVPGQSWL